MSHLCAQQTPADYFRTNFFLMKPNDRPINGAVNS